jgi:hypothetical protein
LGSERTISLPLRSLYLCQYLEKASEMSTYERFANIYNISTEDNKAYWFSSLLDTQPSQILEGLDRDCVNDPTFDSSADGSLGAFFQLSTSTSAMSLQQRKGYPYLL